MGGLPDLHHHQQYHDDHHLATDHYDHSTHDYSAAKHDDHQEAAEYDYYHGADAHYHGADDHRQQHALARGPASHSADS